MNNLNFGSRKRLKVRRRAALKRFGIGIWALGLAGAQFGLPGPSSGPDVVRDFLGGREVLLREADVSTTESARSALEFRQGVFDSRPAPKPSSSETTGAEPGAQTDPLPAPAGSLEEIIYAAAAEYGVDGGYLLGIASCESGLNPGAVNPAGYHGLFQYGEATWVQYGHGSIYDPVAQSRTTAMLISQGGASHWPNCA